MSKDTANLVYEIQRKLSSIGDRLNALRTAMNISEKSKRLDFIEQKMQEPDFWSNLEQASSFQKEKSELKRELDRFNQAWASHVDYLELIDLVKDDADALLELNNDTSLLLDLVSAIETECMLSGPQDKNNAILSINVGQGGVDSQDFSEMLLRMYRRYAERKGFNITVMDLQPAEEAGIKSATILISGLYAYGYLKSEVGVHRLVRISPFDSNARRHTSFASVWVIPEIDDTIDVEIKPDDLRIDTFRSGGAGGQHV